MRPTQAQLDLADRLGLDIPEGVTKSGLSKLLDGAIEADRASKRSDLPIEVAAATGLQHVPQHRIEDIRRLRESRISTGSLTRVMSDPDAPRAVVISSNDADILYFRVMYLETRRMQIIRFDRLEFVYSPPTTHIHPFCAFPAPHDKDWASHKPVLMAFIEFAEPLIEPNQLFRNEHGVFWNAAAVAELKNKFIALQEAAKVSPPKKPAQKRFCVICGKGQIPRMFSSKGNRCVDCHQKQLPAERFCFYCGHQFTFIPGGGKAWLAVTCSDCREKNPEPPQKPV